MVFYVVMETIISQLGDHFQYIINYFAISTAGEVRPRPLIFAPSQTFVDAPLPSAATDTGFDDTSASSATAADVGNFSRFTVSIVAPTWQASTNYQGT